MIAVMSKTYTPETKPLEEEFLLARLSLRTSSELRSVQGKAGQVLFRAGAKPQWLYFVRHGEVRLQRVTTAGAPVLLQRVTHGVFAEPSLTSASYYCEGVCHVDTNLMAIPIKSMRDAIDGDSAVRWHWIEALGAQARRQKARAERLQLKTVRERLVHLILTDGPGDGSYQLPSTRLSLAEELGVSPEALYRTLAALQAASLLAIDGSILQWTESENNNSKRNPRP
ncbi:MAG: Crp/Fnr family transcriptional regulator [Pseudomonadota bacterium]